MNKGRFTQRLGGFITGQGFYIVLFLCVAAIGISGYYLFRSASVSPDPAQPGEDMISVSLPLDDVIVQTDTDALAPGLSAEDEDVQTAVLPVEEEPSVQTQAPAEETVQTSSVTEEVEEAAAAAPVEDTAPTLFVWPIKGTIIEDFAADQLVFSPVLGDWRTHEAIDISSPLGTQVSAAASGTVTDVSEDLLLGTCVTISHGGGLESVYGNLQTIPTVAVGDSVEVGGVIGAVGETAMGENTDTPHLHFAMYQDGLPVDPNDFLPGQL